MRLPVLLVGTQGGRRQLRIPRDVEVELAKLIFLANLLQDRCVVLSSRGTEIRDEAIVLEEMVTV